MRRGLSMRAALRCGGCRAGPARQSCCASSRSRSPSRAGTSSRSSTRSPTSRSSRRGTSRAPRPPHSSPSERSLCCCSGRRCRSEARSGCGCGRRRRSTRMTCESSSRSPPASRRATSFPPSHPRTGLSPSQTSSRHSSRSSPAPSRRCCSARPSLSPSTSRCCPSSSASASPLPRRSPSPPSRSPPASSPTSPLRCAPSQPRASCRAEQSARTSPRRTCTECSLSWPSSAASPSPLSSRVLASPRAPPRPSKRWAAARSHASCCSSARRTTFTMSAPSSPSRRCTR
mmetsp:Transcript_36380/g.113941  ORF Transcript_36380/g.113941 Transcript_36380/m.113941 type:complete len:287 (+) Transcript_36380:118-978(+)